MPYRFATENRDYSDYASGRFFYAAPGHPALPVRLSSEIFQRCLAHLRESGRTAPVTIYDPTCGSAYHLTTLAFLHWPDIDTIIASDINPDILSVAIRNLNLLTSSGPEQRIQEIKEMIDKFGKASHTAALASAHRFNRHMGAYNHKHQIKTRTFTADAANPDDLAGHLKDQPIDLVLSDVPYGRRASWQHPGDGGGNPLTQMLSALRPCLAPHSIAAIVFNKAQTFSNPGYERVEKFQIGKRRVELLRKSI